MLHSQFLNWHREFHAFSVLKSNQQNTDGLPIPGRMPFPYPTDKNSALTQHRRNLFRHRAIIQLLSGRK